MNAARAGLRPWLPPDVLDAPSRRPPPPVVEAVPAVPDWTEADIDAAVARGLREGAMLAERSTAERTARALEQIAASVAAALDAADKRAARVADDLAGVLIEAMQAAFPALETRLGPREAALLAAAVLPGLAREGAVSIRIAPGGVAALDAELARLPDPARALLRVEPDPAMGEADLRVIWRDGDAIRDGAAIRRAVIDALGALAEPAAAEGTDT